MDESQFGIYFYGSVAQKRSAVFSDLDLIIISNVVPTENDKKEWIRQLFTKYPIFRKKFLDISLIIIPQGRPLFARDMIGLCWLQRHPEMPILGSDLLNKTYRTTWDDYVRAQDDVFQYWMKLTNNCDPTTLFNMCNKSKLTRNLYGICFSFSLYIQLLKNPKQWFFRYDEIKNPLMNEVRDLVRQQWHYKTPQNKTEIRRLRGLCIKINHLSLSLIDQRKPMSQLKTG